MDEMQQLRQQMHEMTTHFSALASSHRRLETIVERELASREWVREEIEEANRPLTEAISALSRDLHKLTVLAEETHRTQEALFRERAQREKQEHDAKIAALERASFRAVLRQGWFWALGLFSLPGLIWGAVEAFRGILGLLR